MCRGDLKRVYLSDDSRLKAMAQPMTSCMSEPMMASSTMSHRIIRGTWTEHTGDTGEIKQAPLQKQDTTGFSFNVS